MQRTLFFVLLITIPAWGFPQSFIRFIRTVEASPTANRQEKLDSFFVVHPQRPFIENDSVCVFLFNGSAQKVTLAGDFTGWKPTLHMRNLPGTSLWYYVSVFENEARLDYQFVVDSTKWMLDPKNPYTCAGGYGKNSELRMPGYRIHPEVQPDTLIPHGRLEETSLQSRYFTLPHHVSVYLPPFYKDGAGKYPMILFHDGLDYINFGSACTTLDHLIAWKKIEPVIAVFVDPLPGERENEYVNDKIDAYCSFLVEELMPFLEKKYAITTDPGKTANAGVSNGGNIALYLGLKYPGMFGKIGAESSNIKDYLMSGYSKRKTTDQDIWIEIGKYDIPELIPMAMKMERILKDKHYNFQFHVWYEGHSWGNWRDHLGLMLQQFFPYM